MVELADIYVPIVLTCIKLIVYAYEYMTLPIYYLFYKAQHYMTFPEAGCHKTDKFESRLSRTLSIPVRDGDPGSSWRAVEYIDNLATVALPGCATLSDLWLRTVQLYPNRPAFGTRQILKTDSEIQSNGKKMIKLTLGEYFWETYQEAEKRVSLLSAGLNDLLSPFSSNKIPSIILSETRPEWYYAAQASFRLNRPIATLYTSLGDDAIVHGLEQTEATLIFTSDELLSRLVRLLKFCPCVKYVVYFSNGVFLNKFGYKVDDLSRFHDTARKSIEDARKEKPQCVRLFDIVELEELGKGVIDRTKRVKGVVDSYVKWNLPEEEQAGPEDLAIIMYTSGSTGTPKGVEITHRNITCSIAGYFRRLPKLYPENDIYIGYLPLAHVLEFLCETCCLIMGIPIGYSNPQTLTDSSSRINRLTCKGDLSELKPTLLATVPAVLERITKLVWKKMKENGPLTEAIFRFAYEYKRRRLHAGFPSFIVDLVIFRKVRSLIGGRVRYMVCGGCPLAEESQVFCMVCFSPIVQGYGLTETCAAATLMEIGDRRCNHVGAPTPSIQIKLREWTEGGYSPYDKPYPRGELMISGGSVTSGYYKNPVETANAFFADKDGTRWFCSGDIGMIHEDGCFSIIDRKKDLVKLQGGEYVSLLKVELAIAQSVYVDNVCVHADPSRDYTICFVSPNFTQVLKLADKLGILEEAENSVQNSLPPESINDCRRRNHAVMEILCKKDQLICAVLEDLQRVGRSKKLSTFEIPLKAYLDVDAWTPESGLVTDAMKIKRFKIRSKFVNEIKQLYDLRD